MSAESPSASAAKISSHVTPLVSAARALKRWRYGSTEMYSVDTFSGTPDLRTVRDGSQYKFYEPKPWPQTPFMLGFVAATALDSLDHAGAPPYERISVDLPVDALTTMREDIEEWVAALAGSHFNIIALGNSTVDETHTTLNACLRHGMFVFAGARDTMAVSAVLDDHGCHPNLAGVLSSERTVDASNRHPLA